MNILIVEDEGAAARRLKKLISELSPEAAIVGTTDSVEATIHWLEEHPKPDLIFMDIHLADGSSFDLFDHVKIASPVVFTTAYDEYAIRAFRVNAFDYLLKPIKSAELSNVLTKARQQKDAKLTDFAPLLEALRKQEPEPYLRRILVRLNNSFKLAEIADAAYFFSRDKITYMVSISTGKRLPLDHPLDKLESSLDPSVFYRINRQFIINVNAIQEMQPYSKSRVRVVLKPPTDQDTIVSTERSSEFKKWLTGG